METVRFEHVSTFECPLGELWQFHMRPDALDRLAPPLSGFRVVDRDRGVADGSVLVAEVGPWPFRQRWRALHAAVAEEVGFADIALESPFPFWLHQHLFEAVPGGGSRLRDLVWVVPPRWAPRWLAVPALRLVLGAMFRFRHRRTRQAVERPVKSAIQGWFARRQLDEGGCR